jgi:hypothetical protein
MRCRRRPRHDHHRQRQKTFLAAGSACGNQQVETARLTEYQQSELSVTSSANAWQDHASKTAVTATTATGTFIVDPHGLYDHIAKL